MPFFDNFPTRNRLSALFDINQPQQAQNQMDLMGANPMTPIQTPSQELDISSLYQPEHHGIDMMNKMISEMPQRNKPGLWRQIFGGLAQAVGGGPGARDQILYGPYYQQLADWNARFKPVEDLANQERGANTANRQFAQTILSNRAAQDKLELATRAQDAKERQQAIDTEIKKFRAAAYDFKSRNPNMLMTTNKQGYLVAVNPQTGEAHYVRDEDGNKIDKITDQDKLELQLDNRLAAIEAEEGSASRLEEIRQRNRETLANLQHTNRTSEIQTRAATGANGGKAETPNERKVREYNAAREAFNTNPEFQKWIALGDPGANDFSIKTPDEMGGFFTTNEEWNTLKQTYAAILNAVYGSERANFYLRSQGLGGQSTNTPAPAPTTTPTTTTTGRVKMQKPDGSMVMVAAKDVERAKSQGYKEVR